MALAFHSRRIGWGSAILVTLAYRSRDVLAAIAGGSMGVPHDQCAEAGKGRESEQSKQNACGYGLLCALGVRQIDAAILIYEERFDLRNGA